MKKKLVVVGMLATIAGVVAAFKSRKKYTSCLVMQEAAKRECRWIYGSRNSGLK